jgi:hypothetical protein
MDFPFRTARNIGAASRAARCPVDSNLEIDSHFRNQIFGLEHRPRDFIESSREIVDTRPLDCNSCGGFVPTVSKQQIAAFTQRSVKVEGVNRPA